MDAVPRIHVLHGRKPQLLVHGRSIHARRGASRAAVPQSRLDPNRTLAQPQSGDRALCGTRAHRALALGAYFNQPAAGLFGNIRKPSNTVSALISAPARDVWVCSSPNRGSTFSGPSASYFFAI